MGFITTHHINAFHLRSLLYPIVIDPLKTLHHHCNYYHTTASHDEFENAVLSTAPAVFVSRTRNPYANAALKTHIFNDDLFCRHRGVSAKGNRHPARLFLYVNDPTVLLGRHGNAWCDSVLPLVRTLDLPILRRHSGGSTVAVDAGTVCFASTSSVLPGVVEAINALPKQVSKRVHPSGALATEEEDPLATVFGAPLATDPLFGGGLTVSADGINVLVDGPVTKLAYDATKNVFAVTAQDDSTKIVALECVAATPRIYEGIVHVNSKLDALNALVRKAQRKNFKNIDLDLEVFLEAVAKNFYSKHSMITDASTKQDEDDNILTAGLFDEIMDTAEQDDAASFVAVDVNSLEKVPDPEQWEWVYGRTPAFTHTLSFYHEIDDVELKFRVVRGYIVAVSCTSAVVDISRIPTDGSVKYCYTELAQFLTDNIVLECLKDNL